MLFNFTEEQLQTKKAIFTLKEIYQQPKIWLEVKSLVEKRKTEILNFVSSQIDNQTKIIFAGAGTSEFAGNTLYPYFIEKGIDAVSIATTDIVTNIEDFVDPKQKTLLVSFARSGNSPESVAAFQMMEHYVSNLTHLVITCNKDGQLAKIAQQSKKNFVFLLPDEANDKSFAMTSSFTGMMVAALLILMIDDWDSLSAMVDQTEMIAKKAMENNFYQLNELAQVKHDRIVFLGSGTFKGLAQEAHLKVLELTAGEISAFFNSPVGFRHGPKSILNKNSLVFIFMNSDPYARKYDFDLLNELAVQRQLDKIVVIDSLNDLEVAKKADLYFSTESKVNNQVMNSLVYATFAQLYAFNKSLSLDKTPDNPWPSGLVNRVVQGVIIHQYKG